MPQVQLPVFPGRSTHLNDDLAFECHGGQITLGQAVKHGHRLLLSRG
jgi:hypothetical protein